MKQLSNTEAESKKGVAYKKIRVCTFWRRGNAEAYLEPSRTSTMELFCERSSMVDFRLSSRPVGIDLLPH